MCMYLSLLLYSGKFLGVQFYVDRQSVGSIFIDTHNYVHAHFADLIFMVSSFDQPRILDSLKISHHMVVRKRRDREKEHP